MKLHLPKINLESVGKVELIIIDIVAAIAPWLAPVIPAYLTNTNMMGSLKYPGWVSFIGALVVECIGLSAIYTATQFRDYNDTKATEKENRLAGMDARDRKIAKAKRQSKAPFGLAILAVGFYTVVVLTVNAALEMDATQKGFTVTVFANALLSSLSIVSGLIVALRSQHRRRLMRFSRRKDAQSDTQNGADSANGAQVARKAIGKADFLRLVGAQDSASVADIAEAHGLNGNYDAWLSSRRSVAELAQMVGVKPRTAQNWINPSKSKERVQA